MCLDPDGRAEQEAAVSLRGLLAGGVHRGAVGPALGQSCVEGLTLVTIYTTDSLLFPTAPWVSLLPGSPSLLPSPPTSAQVAPLTPRAYCLSLAMCKGYF